LSVSEVFPAGTALTLPKITWKHYCTKGRARNLNYWAVTVSIDIVSSSCSNGNLMQQETQNYCWSGKMSAPKSWTADCM